MLELLLASFWCPSGWYGFNKNKKKKSQNVTYKM
jgi:hypothetical protein